MGRKAQVPGIIAGIALVAAVSVTAAAGAGRRSTPGVTATTSRSAARSRSPGSRRSTRQFPPPRRRTSPTSTTHGGVNGRKINFIILDDAYDPSKTVPLVQQLVEQDKVFAIFGSLGTAPGLATWDYLNSQKVPQVLVATGDSYWGFSTTRSTRGRSAGSRTIRASRSSTEAHRCELPNREDRRALPERRLRQELLRRPARRLGAKKSNIVERAVL